MVEIGDPQQSASVDSFSTTAICPRQLANQFIATYPVDRWESVGFFDRKDLSWINCHWMGFEPIQNWVHFLLAFFYFCVFLTGFFSNSITILVIARFHCKIFMLDDNLVVIFFIRF